MIYSVNVNGAGNNVAKSFPALIQYIILSIFLPGSLVLRFTLKDDYKLKVNKTAFSHRSRIVSFFILYGNDLSGRLSLLL